MGKVAITVKFPDPIDNLPYFEEIDFAEVKNQFGIVKGDWVLRRVTLQQPREHSAWHFYKPDPRNESVYLLRGFGHSFDSKSIFYINSDCKTPLVANSEKMKAVFNENILALVCVSRIES